MLLFANLFEKRFQVFIDRDFPELYVFGVVPQINESVPDLIPFQAEDFPFLKGFCSIISYSTALVNLCRNHAMVRLTLASVRFVPWIES